MKWSFVLPGAATVGRVLRSRSSSSARVTAWKLYIPTHSRSRWGVGDLLARRRKGESCETWELISCLPGWRKRTFQRSTSSTPSRPMKRFRGRRELDLVGIVSDVPARTTYFLSIEWEEMLHKRKLIILKVTLDGNQTWCCKK